MAGGSGTGNATGGLQLRSTARTANYALLTEPCVLRCTLCQVLLTLLLLLPLDRPAPDAADLP